MRKLFIFTAMVFICSLTFVCSARADTAIYNNIGAYPDGADPVSSFGPLYDSFTSPSSIFSLTDVQLLLQLNPTAPPGAGSLNVTLYNSNSSTNPIGTMIETIGTLSNSSLFSNPSVFDFPLLTPYALSVNTVYWIGLSGNSTSAEWSWSTDTSGLGVANQSFANSDGVYPYTDGPYQMQVSGIFPPLETPEPGMASLLLLGLGLVGVFRRKLLS